MSSRTSRFLVMLTIQCLWITCFSQEARAEQLDSPIFFQKTHTQHAALVDRPGGPDYQASGRWNDDGSLSAWYCGTEKFASNGQTHDTIYTSTLFPGQTDSNPEIAIHSAGDDPAKHDRFDAFNICSPTVVDLPRSNEDDWTLMYYECSPVVFDGATNTPGDGDPTGNFIASFVQVCLARLTDDGWKLYNEQLWQSQGIFGDPETTRPTPVVRVSDDFYVEAELADDNETGDGEFVPPIDGHLYGNDTVLRDKYHYGAGHPNALAHELPQGDYEIWLYYWDSEEQKQARVRSTDGINFFDRTYLNPNHGSHIKFFPDLEIDGQSGVYVGSSLFQNRRWFEYSFDGVHFEAPAFGNPDEKFLLNASNPGYLCTAPGAGSFVSDRLGHVHGSRDFAFLSGEGFLGTFDNGADPVRDCYHVDEDDVRGSTWGIYYFEGEFSDVDVADESCEFTEDPAEPNGRVSSGTEMGRWVVDQPNKTGRNRVIRSETGGTFPMAFFNNGLPMDGINTCFMKQQSSIRQTLDGFTPGKEYRVRAWANARTSAVPEAFPTPVMQIELGGQVVESGVAVPAVDVKNGITIGFRELVSASSFVAPSNGPFDLVIRQVAAGDATLLLDRILVEPVPEPLEVANGSCEEGVIGLPYGLVDQGTTMPGWQASDPHLTGRNTAGMVFYNNGATVDGTAVCLLKQESAITQVVPGFRRGKEYRVRIWANARTSIQPGVYPTPILRVELGNQVLEPGLAVPAVDAHGSYTEPFREILIRDTFLPLFSQPYELRIEQIEGGDPTLLIDKVVIEPAVSFGG